MNRRLTRAFDAWARSAARKPMVLRGARQVGKSWLVREWGAKKYGSVVELNFERDPQLARAFQRNDPKFTLRRLEELTHRVVRLDSTNLLFLDEIQAAPELLAKLRWFAEELPQLPLIAAGSLLDFALADHTFSMPVGRIAYRHLEPMGFEEFLEAVGESRLVELLSRVGLEPEGELIDAVHERLLELFRTWVLVGGMPAAVARWVETRTLASAREAQGDVLATLRDDFNRYGSRAQLRRLTEVFDSVPRQLGSKFTYSRVEREERPRDLAKAVELLCLARACHRVRASDAAKPPLAAAIDAKHFKLLMGDVGLVCAALDAPAGVELGNEGGLAEQAVGQLLRLNFEPSKQPELFYWRRNAPGSDAEVDYLIEHGGKLVPVEVKAGTTGQLKSLQLLMAKRKWKRAVRFNADMPSVVESAGYELISLPLYMVEQLPRLLDERRAK